MLKHLHVLYSELKRDGVMLCFIGPMSQTVVEVVGRALKRKLELEDAGMTTIQRIFSIFIEQMQNIVNYSSEQLPEDNGAELKHGIVIVGRCATNFYVICGNSVHVSQGERLLERIRKLQKMSREELKEYYKRMRRQESDAKSKGAGLGFIEMFRRASEPLECHMASIDAETVFFSIKAIG
mgnify:CR=1 FL=1